MAIGPGSRGEEVRQHQLRLRAAGYDPGPIDGIWGPKTQAATQAHHDAVITNAPSQAPPVEPASAILHHTLDQYGLGNLANWAWDQYKGVGGAAGKPMEQVMLEIRNTPEYKARFPAMNQLSGLQRSLTEAEYVETEKAYASLMHSYGLPRGFYDSPDDFGQLMAQEVSPAELDRRLSVYQQAAYSAPKETRDELERLYGVGPGGLMAFYIDPDKALPLLQQQFEVAHTSGLAKRAGMANMNIGEAERFASLSPAEVTERIRLFEETAFGQPDEVKQELARLYGISDLTSFTVNPDVAIALLKQKVQAAITGGLSRVTGFGFLNQREAERLGALGVTEQAFQAIVSAEELFQDLPGGAVDSAGNRRAKIDVLAGDQKARDKLEKVAAGRVAEFEGGGSFAQSTKGITGLKAP